MTLSNSILYVFDNTCDARKMIRYCVRKDAKKVFLCPITTDQDVVSSVFRNISLCKNFNIEVLDFLGKFNKTAFSERDRFSDFVAGLRTKVSDAGGNIELYFQYPRSNFSLWEPSLIAEKNPLKSNSYNSLIKMLTILKFIRENNCGTVAFDIGSTDLGRTIRKNASLLGYNTKDFKGCCGMAISCGRFLINFLKALKYYLLLIWKVLAVRVDSRERSHQRKRIERADCVAITYFPLIERTSLQQKKFVNKYYGLLQTALEHRYKDSLIWLAAAPGIYGMAFGESLRLAREMRAWGYPIYLEEEWITLRDLCGIAGRYFYFMVKCAMKTHRFLEKFIYPDIGIAVGDLFEEDWFASFSGSVLMNNLVHCKIFNTIGRCLKDDAMVIYLAENQGWEKILNFVIHNRKKIQTLGIAHTSIPLLFLPYSKGTIDRKAAAGNIFAPDRLACNGRIPLRILRESGWDEEKTFVLFAMRYQHLKRYLENNIPWKARHDKVLVTLSSNKKESEELLAYIYQAFTEEHQCDILIKGHYVLPAEPLVRRLGLNLGKRFIITEEELTKLLPVVKAMVVASSSATLEAIALGCPVVIPLLSGVVDMNPLSGVSDLAFYVSNPDKLKGKIGEFLVMDRSPLPYDICKRFIEDYFEFSVSEKELIDKIEGLSATAENTVWSRS